jgi:hypothetical protein
VQLLNICQPGLASDAGESRLNTTPDDGAGQLGIEPGARPGRASTTDERQKWQAVGGNVMSALSSSAATRPSTTSATLLPKDALARR